MLQLISMDNPVNFFDFYGTDAAARDYAENMEVQLLIIINRNLSLCNMKTKFGK